MDRTLSARQRRKIVVWRWLGRGRPNPKWRELPGTMTDDEAAAWANARGREIERIEGTAKVADREK